MPTKQPARIVLTNVGLALCGLTVLELSFGGWIAEHDLSLLNIPRAVRVTADSGDLYDDPDGTVVVYSRDDYGLRGPYQDISQIDILTIGGSTTDQRYITDGRTWQDTLSQAAVKAGSSLQVANAGVDGHTTYGNIKSFDSWFSAIPNLRPRFVLIYTGINDFWVEEGDHNSFDDLQKRNVSFADRALESSAFVRVYRWLQGAHSARYEARLFHHRENFSEWNWVSTGIYVGAHEELMADKLRRYSSRLTALTSRVRQMGATPILVTQPHRVYKFIAGVIHCTTQEFEWGAVKVNGVDVGHMMRLMDWTTMRICEGEDAICIDLAVDLHLEDADFYDLAHNTPTGAAKVGRFLFHRLEGAL